jgi:hypothetical protein
MSLRISFPLVLNFGEIEMLNLLKALRQDEHGVILSAEIVIIGSLLVIGLITGLTCLQKSVNGELQDLAGAIGALDQTYSFSAHRKSGFDGQCCAYTAGSSFVNCENKDQKCGDIVGSVGCETSAACGNCGQCSGTTQGVSACGSCGGHGAGCTACGSTGFVGTKNSRCIDTGVPKMKVTEWNGPRTVIDQPQVVLPEVVYPVQETTVVPSQALEQYPVHPHPSEVIIDQSGPVVPHQLPMQIPPAPPQPAIEPIPPQPATEPIPMPASELPATPGLPMPPSA